MGRKSHLVHGLTSYKSRAVFAVAGVVCCLFAAVALSIMWLSGMVTAATSVPYSATFCYTGDGGACDYTGTTWTRNIPAHAINITAEVWGGGGGGGGAANGLYGGSGGGGSGGYIKKNFGKSQAASTIGITVGRGGPRGEKGQNDGTAGGSSNASYGGTTITANGGNPGGGAPGTGQGTGGSGGTTSNNGDVNTTGNAGTAGCCSGDGSGKKSGKGGDAPNGGAGGASVGGSTGTYIGQAGYAPGGGGGGARTNLTNSEPGGVGGSGRVIVSWSIFTAEALITSLSPDNGLTSPGSNVANRTVTINGNFADIDLNAFTVYFGAQTASVISSSSTQIVVSYPETATTGSVNVYIAYTDSVWGFTDWVTNSVSFTYSDMYVSISSSSETLTTTYSPRDALPANGVYAMKSGFEISTNNPTGYNLTLEPQGGGIDLVCSTNGSLAIPTTSNGDGTLADGTYGYKLSSSSQVGVNSGWNAMLSTQTVKTTAAPSVNDPINGWFGVRLHPGVAACSSYTRQFLWTVMANT